LATVGFKRSILLERDAIASGSTSKATGGFRHQFSNEANIRLSKESFEFYSELERKGSGFSMRRVGYMFLLPDDDAMLMFERSALLQRSLGVETEMLTPEEVRRRYPQLDVTGLVGASFCAMDGVGSPVDAANAIAMQARDLGVTIRQGCPAVAIEVQRGRVVGVRTANERIACELAVIACGAWTPELMSPLGIKLSIEPHPRQVFVLSPVTQLNNLPFIVDMQSGVYIHSEPNVILLGGGDRDRPPSYGVEVDWERLPSVAAAMIRRLPSLSSSQSISAWCGLREMTPDEFPLIGPISGIEGLWCAAGFSGHGFMHAPAAGRILSRLITTGHVEGYNVAAFRPDRFESRQPANAERAVF
jgi:sarcosine oxidase subunit beta